jgi:hypothetical protein
MTTIPVDFTDLSDARAGAVKVAERYGLNLYIWQLAPSGRFMVNNIPTAPYANATLVESHLHRIKDPPSTAGRFEGMRVEQKEGGEK